MWFCRTVAPVGVTRMIGKGRVGLGMRFEELDWCQTRMGAISLRRRLDPLLKVDVYEVKLADEFLMSSLFTAAEVQLAQMALAAAPAGPVDVVVGGLGLGYTARGARLADRRPAPISGAGR